MNAEPQSADTMNEAAWSARRVGRDSPQKDSDGPHGAGLRASGAENGSAALPLVRDARVPGFARRTRAGGARYEAVPEAPARLAVE